MSLSKVIPHDADVSVTPWFIPDVDSISTEQTEVFTPDMGGDSSQTQRAQDKFDRDYNVGFEKGYAEGKKAADEELALKQVQLNTLLDFLARPVEKLEEQVEHELTELALAIAKQILRREISIDPKHIIGLIRTSVAQLPAAENEVVVSLNPGDAKIIRKALKKTDNKQRWQIVEDPGLNAGSCNINSENSFVDGSIDAMISQMSLDLFGGHRGKDSKKPSKASKKNNAS